MRDSSLWIFRFILVTVFFLFISTWTSLSTLEATLWSLLIVFVSIFLGEPVYYALVPIIVLIVAVIGVKYAELISKIVSLTLVTGIAFIFANIIIEIDNNM